MTTLLQPGNQQPVFNDDDPFVTTLSDGSLLDDAAVRVDHLTDEFHDD